MEEPNLNYIDQLCAEDDEFKQKIITIIKKELPLEITAYYKSIESKNYKLASEVIHKLKHKISILGLEKSYDLAQEYENHLLKNGTFESEGEFARILQLMQSFVNDL
ncbi:MULTISPECIES: histidine kinase [Flavobacterium]|jgi:hypothetical protein|uniref:Histidine kinase n=2 Tax=Flavobacterium TaxID=237 RepID=A0A1S1JBX7_9FLAO|nr:MULTISPECIES: histidine kinase [Flavobacterium]MCC9020501.1 Hpt domain-containing protein [Flavobacterium sp. F-126]MDL2145479.1 Hpt domain-containing protein [Flavobacterium tructae]OHT47071.1 histidine kinase [Flavobacterium tructae]OXB15742.1 histidine kinase [Flavobacterium tructae]GIQ61260.1 histidine kinase [Flavobacterium collinsii]